MLGGTLVAAGVVVIAAIVISSSGGTAKPHAESVSANRATITAVTQELAGIAQSGQRLGRPSAPVKLTYFGDLECPICQSFTLGALQDLIARDVRSGRLEIIYRSFETATRDPGVFAAQQAAAYAAGRQNRAWEYIDLFYREQGAEGTGYVTESYLNGLARQTPGLKLARWTSDRTLAAVTGQVTRDEQLAQTSGVNGTPTLLIQGPKGHAAPIAGNAGYSQIEQAITSVQ